VDERLRRGAIEFSLIVLGVLVALAADQWWQEQEEREALGDYLRQIEAGLEQDIELLDSRDEVIELRLQVIGMMQRLSADALADRRCRDFGSSLLVGICDGTEMGKDASLSRQIIAGAFAAASPLSNFSRSAGYEDLREVGLFRLVFPDTRVRLTHYYQGRQTMFAYSLQVETELPLGVYGLVPANWVGQAGASFTLDPGLPEAEVEAVARALLTSSKVRAGLGQQARRLDLQLIAARASLRRAGEALDAVRESLAHQ
jgi:hypothetical protein